MRNDNHTEPRSAASEAPDPPPVCRLIGTAGNVFAIIGKVRRTLHEAGQPERANAFSERAFQSRSYDEVLQLCMEYVEVQ